MIMAGVARRDITPSLSVPHAAWGAQAHVFAAGIEAELYTTVLVIGDGADIAVIIDADAGLFLIDQADEVRYAVAQALGIGVESIRLSVTHTHAGPCFWSDYYAAGKEARQAYFQYLTAQTAAAAQEAKLNRVGVSVGAGTGLCAIGKNRRQRLDDGRIIAGYEEHGVADPTVGVIRFEDGADAERVIATIVHYSCHPTTLGYTNRLHSPDFPGVTKRMVERNLGGLCLFLQGSAGNIGPGPEGFLDNLPAVRTIGSILGAEAVKLSLEISAASWEHRFVGIVESGASLGIWQSAKKAATPSFRQFHTRIELPLRQRTPLEEAARKYRELADELRQLQMSNADNEAIRSVSYKVKRAFLDWDTSRKYSGMTHSSIEVQFLRLQDIVLIGAPLEPFVEIGLHIKANSPFRVTLFSGYANGHLGYLPIAGAYEEGGYEVETSPFAQGAAEYFMAEIIAVLEAL